MMLDRALPKVLAAPLVRQPENKQLINVNINQFVTSSLAASRTNCKTLSPLRWPVEFVHTVKYNVTQL